MDLDAMLTRAAAPAKSSLDPNVDAVLRSLVVRSESSARRTRCVTRLAAVAAGSAGLIVVATGASATGLLPEWRPWSTQSGTTCEVGFLALSTREAGGGPLTAKAADLSSSQTDEAVEIAQTYLDGVDLGSIDVPEVVAAFRQEESRVRSAQPADERQPQLHGGDLEITAVGAEVQDRLDEYLTERHVDPTVVVLSRGSRCQ